MTCAACAARIEKVLNRVDGVHAEVNFATETAHVEFDGAKATPRVADRSGEEGGVRRRARRRPLRAARAGGARPRRSATGASWRVFAVAALLTLPFVVQMAAMAAGGARSNSCRSGCSSRSPRRSSSGRARASMSARGRRCAAAPPTWTCWSRSARPPRSRSASRYGSCRLPGQHVYFEAARGRDHARAPRQAARRARARPAPRDAIRDLLQAAAADRAARARWRDGGSAAGGAAARRRLPRARRRQRGGRRPRARPANRR